MTAPFVSGSRVRVKTGFYIEEKRSKGTYDDGDAVLVDVDVLSDVHEPLERRLTRKLLIFLKFDFRLIV